MTQSNGKHRMILFLGSGASYKHIMMGSEMMRYLKLLCNRDYNHRYGIESVLRSKVKNKNEIYTFKQILMTLCFDRKNGSIENILQDISKIESCIKSIKQWSVILFSIKPSKESDQSEVFAQALKYYFDAVEQFNKLLNNDTRKISNEKAIMKFASKMNNTNTRRKTHINWDQFDTTTSIIKQLQMCQDTQATINQIKEFILTMIYKLCTVPDVNNWSERNIKNTNFNLDYWFDYFNINNIDLTISTSNFDLLPEIIMRAKNINYIDGFNVDGTYNGKFTAVNNNNTNTTVKLLKIHGSVDRYQFEKNIMKNTKIVPKIEKFLTNEKCMNESFAEKMRNKMMRELSNNDIFNNNLIYHGSDIHSVHSDSVNELQNDIQKADAMVVIGYGFNDELNIQLLNCIKQAAARGILVVVDPYTNIQDSMSKRGIIIDNECVINSEFIGMKINSIIGRLRRKFLWIN